jgi:hypothetical protein
MSSTGSVDIARDCEGLMSVSAGSCGFGVIDSGSYKAYLLALLVWETNGVASSGAKAITMRFQPLTVKKVGKVLTAVPFVSIARALRSMASERATLLMSPAVVRNVSAWVVFAMEQIVCVMRRHCDFEITVYASWY